MIYVDENLDENSEGEKLFCGLDSYHFCAFDISDFFFVPFQQTNVISNIGRCSSNVREMSGNNMKCSMKLAGT